MLLLSSRSDVEKEEFWDNLMTMASYIFQHAAIVIAGDLNGHVDIKADGYNSVYNSKNTVLQMTFYVI